MSTYCFSSSLPKSIIHTHSPGSNLSSWCITKLRLDKQIKLRAGKCCHGKYVHNTYLNIFNQQTVVFTSPHRTSSHDHFWAYNMRHFCSNRFSRRRCVPKIDDVWLAWRFVVSVSLQYYNGHVAIRHVLLPVEVTQSRACCMLNRNASTKFESKNVICVLVDVLLSFWGFWILGKTGFKWEQWAHLFNCLLYLNFVLKK